jgi:hypothetical protein
MATNFATHAQPIDASSPQLCQICHACLVDHVGLTSEPEPKMQLRFASFEYTRVPGYNHFLEETTFYHHYSYETFKDSALSKCPICALLWSQHLHYAQIWAAVKPDQERPLTRMLLIYYPIRKFLDLVVELNRVLVLEPGVDEIRLQEDTYVSFALTTDEGSITCSPL